MSKKSKSKSRFSKFTKDEINLIEEALSAYTDNRIREDDFYDDSEHKQLGKIRDAMFKEITKDMR